VEGLLRHGQDGIYFMLLNNAGELAEATSDERCDQ
jgi:hypothetical protein